MIPDPEYLVYGFLGAASRELLQLGLYRVRLSPAKLRRIYRSRIYWLSVAFLVLGSALLAWGLHAGDEVTVKTIFVTAIAAGTIIRDLVTINTSRDGVEQGPISLSDVFS